MKLVFFILGASMALINSCTHTDHERVLLVGSPGDYPPFSSYDREKDLYTGLDIEIIKEIAAQLGRKIVWKKTTWSDLLPGLISRKFDLAVGGITITKSRKKKAYMTKGYLRFGKQAISRCEDKKNYSDIKAINQKGVRVIFNPGGTNEKYARVNFSKAELILFEDNTKIFEQIIMKKADVMVTDSPEVAYQLNRYPNVLCSDHQKPFTSEQLGFLISPEFQMKEQIDEELQKLKNSQYLEALIKKYIPGIQYF